MDHSVPNEVGAEAANAEHAKTGGLQMAERSEITRRNDAQLAYISAMVDDMRQIPDLWAGVSEIIRTDWEMEWCEQMDRLGGLEESYLKGEMTVEQMARYRELLAKLKANLPVINRLGLESPSVQLEAEAA